MRRAADGKGGRGANLTNRFHVLGIRNYNDLLGVHFQSCLYIVVDQRHVSDGVQGLQVSRHCCLWRPTVRACAPSILTKMPAYRRESRLHAVGVRCCKEYNCWTTSLLAIGFEFRTPISPCCIRGHPVSESSGWECTTPQLRGHH